MPAASDLSLCSLGQRILSAVATARKSWTAMMRRPPLSWNRHGCQSDLDCPVSCIKTTTHVTVLICRIQRTCGDFVEPQDWRGGTVKKPITEVASGPRMFGTGIRRKRAIQKQIRAAVYSLERRPTGLTDRVTLNCCLSPPAKTARWISSKVARSTISSRQR